VEGRRKTSKSLSIKYPIWTLSFSLLAGATYFSPDLTSLFIYDREALLAGEVWRLLSAHLVHFSGQHLCYDLIAFSIAGSFIESYSHQKWFLLCSMMALFISIVLFLAEPDMRYYGGLSGLAVGSIFYLILFHLYYHLHSKFWWMVLLIILSKMMVEILYSNTPSNGLFVHMPLSHIIGSLVALVIFYGERLFFDKR